jgi:partner of Y14 and mago protein
MPSSNSSPSRSDTPRSGAITTPTGDRHIPSSTRPDGSLRKEIKIRPGYRPPEDVEVYKNRTAESWKNRGSSSIPGSEGLNPSGGLGETAAGSAAGKNAKRREARKRAKDKGGEEGDGGLNGDAEKVEGWQQFSTNPKAGSKGNWRAPMIEEPETGLDPEAEREKQARKLGKKLRQARELREKKDNGENLLPEQFEKVIKIHELIRQLDSLGFDSEGVKKAEDGSC